MFKDIENIIFDLDNTLYNFSELWLLANEEIFYFYNFDEFTTYEKFFDEYKRQNKILVDMAKRGKLRLNVIRPLRIINTLKVFNKNVDEKFSESFYEKLFLTLVDKIEKDNLLIEKLTKLRKYYKIFLLTNGQSIEQNKKLEKLAIKNIFHNIYISEKTWKPKPYPMAFLNVIESNNIEKEKTLMVGDSYYHDIKPAKELGIKVCFIEKVWHLEDDNNKHNYKGINCFDNIYEVLDILIANKEKNT